MSQPFGPSPRVTLKLATSIDARIATASGESQWITGPTARAAAHRLRAEHDAVLVGSQTVLDDDPLLTARAPDLDPTVQPARIVADARMRVTAEHQIVRTARAHPAPTVIVVAQGRAAAAGALEAVGVMVIEGRPAPGGGIVVDDILHAILALGLETVMIEGGGAMAASFLRAGRVDRIDWFRAPIVLGGEGRPAVGGLAVSRLGAAPRFRLMGVERLDDDLLERYVRSDAGGTGSGED